ncbi:MAG: carbon-nitrogen family hydrolase [Syntrophobacteraceae bacterium]|jgi:predicted amidohydrolase
MQNIVAGCCQLSIKPGEVQYNCETVERMLSELAAGNCRLAVLPEMWSCSFPYPVLREMAKETPAILDRMSKIAKDKRLVIAGSLPEAQNETIFNTSYLINSTGKIAGKYRKVHLFSLYNEQRYFSEGTSAEVFSTSIGKIGLMICYDLRFPELARRLAIDGAEIICVSALWPLVRIDHWSLLLRARAVENQLFVIGCNGCGAEEKITWGGASAVISPLGSVVALAGPGEQSILGALDKREMSEFRKTIPCFEDRVPEVYEPYYDIDDDDFDDDEIPF